MATESTLGERLAYMEGQLHHLATKADVAALEATVTTAAWALGLGIALLGALQVYAVRKTARRTEQ